MRALVFDDNLQFRPDYPDPVPAANECLLRIRVAGICRTDLEIARGYMGFRGVLGHECVGTVEQGPAEWLNRRVVSEINCVCRVCPLCQSGLSTHCRRRTVVGIDGRDGGFADLLAVPTANLHEVPDGISDDEAVFVEPLAAAWQVVQQVPVDPRTRVAVVGSGRLGLLVAQVIKTLGAQLEVIGRNPRSLAVCDRRHIQTVHADDIALRNDFDLVVDCTGAPAGLQLALGLVRPRGTIVLKSTYADGGQLDLAPAVINEVSIIGSRCGPFATALASLQRREIDVHALVSKTFPLERGVDAFTAAADPANIKVLLKITP